MLGGRPTGLPVDVFAFLDLLSAAATAAAGGLGGLTTETLPDAVRPLLMFFMALVVPLLKVNDLGFGGGGGGGGGGSGSERAVEFEPEPEPEAARGTVDALGKERFFLTVVVGAGVGILMLGWTKGIFKLMDVEVFIPVPATSLFFASSNASCSTLI